MKMKFRFQRNRKQPRGREFHFAPFTPQGKLQDHRTDGVVGDGTKRKEVQRSHELFSRACEY